MNAAPSQTAQRGGTDIELEQRKAELINRFAQLERDTGEDKLVRLTIACSPGLNDASQHRASVQKLVMATIATAAKKGLMVTGGIPGLDEESILPVFVDQAGISLDGHSLVPRISVHRASMDDIDAIDAARRNLEGVMERTLRDVRNALMQSIRKNAQQAFESAHPFM